jgi:hypothetical protein
MFLDHEAFSVIECEIRKPNESLDVREMTVRSERIRALSAGPR